MAAAPPDPAVPDVPPTRFAAARGARIAYQEFGHGPTVVAVPPMAQNIEVAWERPEIRAMFERFGSFCHWIQFDKRGTGASDRRGGPMSGIDERVDDLRAVMDDAGIERAFLYGASEGGPMCLLFAVTFPQRVEALILHGSGARTGPVELEGDELQDARRHLDWYAEVWGTPESPVVDHFAPSMARDGGFRDWHQRYERLSADRDSLRELLEMSLEVDVRPILREVAVPTLLLHRRGDRIIPLEWAEEAAAEIPDAELVVEEGADHFSYAGDQGWIEHLERFVTGTVQPDRPPVRQTVVQIRTFGRFGVWVDGTEIPTAEWGSRLARQLLKRLVAARGWPVTREELFDLFWPDETDTRRLGPRLSVLLSNVRRILGGGIVADRQTVALNLDEVSTDLEYLHRATADEKVVEIYSGELLPEDRFEEWSVGPRDEARARFSAAGHRLAAAALAEGDLETASSVARRLIESDRYDEGAHETLVRALALGDAAGEARLAHSRWAEALAELDVSIAPYAELGLSQDDAAMRPTEP